MNGVFVTGTDTGVGKTVVACSLLRLATTKGLKASGYKPVASGCEWVDGQLRNEDAIQLMQASNADLSYGLVNPLPLEPAIAPHVAAEEAGLTLSVAEMLAGLDRVRKQGIDYCVIEGAGGWLVPLNHTETFADFAIATGFPIVLTVGLKLGCINHATLTAQSIAQAGAHLVGWVGNTIDPEMSVMSENIETLKRQLAAPCLGVIEHLDQPDSGTATRFMTFDFPAQ